MLSGMHLASLLERSSLLNPPYDHDSLQALSPEVSLPSILILVGLPKAPSLANQILGDSSQHRLNPRLSVLSVLFATGAANKVSVQTSAYRKFPLLKP